jgi:hypothetical protein
MPRDLPQAVRPIRTRAQLRRQMARATRKRMPVLRFIMKKALLPISLLALMGSGPESHAFGNETLLRRPVSPPVAFREGEIQFDLSPSAAVGHSPNHSGPFRKDVYGVGIGANYYFNTYFGLGVDATWLNGDRNASRGTGSVDLGVFTGSVLARLPLEEYRMAPYAFFGGGVTAGDGSWGSAHWGLGIEYRVVPDHVGLFGDGRWNFYGSRFAQGDQNNFQFRAGIRLIF